MSTHDTFNARDAYRIPAWSAGYVDVAANGELQLAPQGLSAASRISLRGLIEQAQQHGLSTPLLARFPALLRHRLTSLHDAFAQAIAAHDYRGSYTSIYPIKVNQQRGIVTTLLQSDRPVGLEAGSRTELLAVIATATPGQHPIICNGYKDATYLRLALAAQRLGHRVIIVIEKFDEFEILHRLCVATATRPAIGIRLRLGNVGSGKWQNSGGFRSKFGLSSSAALKLVERLRDTGLDDCVRLLHFHMGSQIPALRDVENGLREGARLYTSLRELGLPLDSVDIGGGLGIDYQGSANKDYCSMDYDMAQYADSVLAIFSDACAQTGAPQPALYTECGRAMTAHHAVLITEVISTEAVTADAAAGTANPYQQQLTTLLADLQSGNAAATLARANRTLADAEQAFASGELSLAERSEVENACNAILHAVQQTHGASPPDADARDVHERMADKYFCNFSLFQSIPDAWAFDQVFPIVPVQRLHEMPDRHGVVLDLTCDSDGQVHRYVTAAGIDSSLPLHSVTAGERYYLAIFLVGAYQEILGDIHNLFGSSHCVEVDTDADNGITLRKINPGNAAADLLARVGYDRDWIQQQFHYLPPGDDRDYLLARLEDYSYLETET